MENTHRGATNHPSNTQRTYSYIHSNSYIKPSSTDLPDFWNFHQKFNKFKQRQPPVSYPVKKNQLGVPSTFNTDHTVPFVCISNREEDDKQKSEQFHEALRHYVQFKTKQTFKKITKQIEYQKELPIYKFKDEIIRTVNSNPITIIAGDTGCGKSTQVPQYFLECGYQSVACTQPRRIACVSLATRVSQETFNKYGQDIGYQVRFDQMLYSNTKLRFLTEGLLLRQLQNDTELHAYDLIILDEVHERHLHGDLLLGILKGIVERRPEIRVVLMSATMNLELFKTYLPDSPLITVPGRMHPVEMRYCPTHETATDKPTSAKINPKPYLIILQLIDTRYTKEERGDLLIFASGFAEIMTLAEAITEYDAEQGKWAVLPLHSSLSVEEQQKVFDYPPPGVRKCIISTNIAETSLTIDGVRFIIDSGKFKEMAYDANKKLQRLQEFWVSKASAEQRKGRAGRTGPGVCFRLYSEEDFAAFADYPTPEILRVPLDSLICRFSLASMGLDIRTFLFVQHPPATNLNESLSFLQLQGALKSENELSSIGEVLARLPVEVALGKLLLSAAVMGVLEPALTIAAGLNIQSVFNKSNCRGEELQIRSLLESGKGDLVTLLNIYEEWSQKKSEGVNTRKWCKKRGLKEQQLYEMSKLRRQFRDILRDHLNLATPQETLDSEKVLAIRRAKWKKRLEEPARKMLKVSHCKNRAGDESEEELSDKEEDNISSMEYFLTNPQPNLDLSGHVRDTLNFVSVFGLYPNIATSDQHNSEKKPSDFIFHTQRKNFVVLHPNCIFNTLHEDLYPSNKQSEQLLAYSTLLETNKPYLTNVTRIQGLTTALLMCKEVSTNGDCTDIVCDMWLRFTLKTSIEDLIHKAVKIRQKWSSMVADVLNHRITDPREFSKRQKRFQKALSSFLRTDVVYTLRVVRSTELSGLVRYEHAVKLDDNITINSVQDSGSSEMEVYLKRAWTCKLCGTSGLFSLAEKSEHLAKCQDEEEEDSLRKIEDEEKKEESAIAMETARTRKIPTKEYSCEHCGEMFQFTNVEILRHIREHDTKPS
ncbi:probable ATP-dependent RNA helicase DHX34 [Bolinopsis microptera]|uniref:probable ATP-dependent RNA helicase DHX34 n=1 Tax=Bolinopsis microptera TaxID=2820187 RepID=UPI00307A8F42